MCFGARDAHGLNSLISIRASRARTSVAAVQRGVVADNRVVTRNRNGVDGLRDTSTTPKSLGIFIHLHRRGCSSTPAR